MLAFPIATFAAELPSTTLISGYVYLNGHESDPVANASVVVTCGSLTIPLTTNSNGQYSTTITDNQCPANSNVVVNASANSGKDTGSNNGPATPYTSINVNLADIDVPIFGVPEFGLIPGAFALFASAGYIVILKRKKVVNK